MSAILEYDWMSAIFKFCYYFKLPPDAILSRAISALFKFVLN